MCCIFINLFKFSKCVIWRPLKCIIKCLLKTICTLLPYIGCLWVWDRIQRINWCKYVGLLGGALFGQIYYEYLIMKIHLPCCLDHFIRMGLSILMAVGNAVCRQLRCISMLCIPMYCGKPGRGVLKAVVLTYVIAGPISNMGLNAREVVRVFACSTHLSCNLTNVKHNLMAGPFHNSVFRMKDDMEQVKDTLRSFRKVAAPIEDELENASELNRSREMSDYIDTKFEQPRRSYEIDKKYALNPGDTEQETYKKLYQKKLEYRCHQQLSLAVKVCIDAFAGVYDKCAAEMPQFSAWAVCWPLKITYICNLMHLIDTAECDSEKHVDPGLAEGYVYLKKVKREMTNKLHDVRLQYKVNEVKALYDIQDAKETGDRIMQAFEEKHIIMLNVINVVNICVALLFIRIMLAAGTYHDNYLTSIGYDNVYITGYFKKIDKRRAEKGERTLLPLKKMERSKYIDVHSTAYHVERNKLMTQVLKVMLEMVTATTFVMLDRLFFEALDVVRQHAEMETSQQGHHDLDIQVQGKGILARAVRTLLSGVKSDRRVKRTVSNRACLPRPHSMEPVFYLKIYGGYLWILLLLYFNPYTLRLRRLICCLFYPRREKQRILHLYNDILKKRVKISKTLRRKAVQAVRAHYLSGENMLSLRIKFPQVLGWMKIFPAARMTCLICGETEPRSPAKKANWQYCNSSECPFVYCSECWREINEHCLACDPSLSELSDIDSLSEDDQPKY